MFKVLAIAMLAVFTVISEVYATYEFTKLDLNIEAQSCLSHTYQLAPIDNLQYNLIDFGRQLRGWGNQDFYDFLSSSHLLKKLAGQRKSGSDIVRIVYSAEKEYLARSASSWSIFNFRFDHLFFERNRSDLIMTILKDSKLVK
jgi:hypothetical protein